jgi:transcriptional regulator of arginine metabolism
MHTMRAEPTPPAPVPPAGLAAAPASASAGGDAARPVSADRTVPMKAQRQRAIVEVVEREAIYSQDLLGQRLRARGFDVTQATLSRDIKELGLVKRASDGAYQRAGQTANGPSTEAAGAKLRRACREFLRSFEQVQQLIVLKTDVGQANVLAVALDRASLPEVAGTIAGDDTILVIAREPRLASALIGQFEEWTGISR